MTKFIIALIAVILATIGGMFFLITTYQFLFSDGNINNVGYSFLSLIVCTIIFAYCAFTSKIKNG